MYKRIDPHVHCRDGNQAYKSTIARVFEIAHNQGVKIIFDMPNTKPPVISESEVLQKLSLVPREEEKNYFLWLGLTSKADQIIKAVDIYHKYSQAIGLKLYAGKSEGDLAVIEPERQLGICKMLAGLHYQGVLAVHCEREDLLKPELWNPLNPISHSRARPKEAEIEAVKDQIRFAKKVRFKGTLHIVHVSCPESVELIKRAREEIRITCGITPHHILYSQETQQGKNGAIYKVNPPLRSLEDIEALRHCLLRGEIDWIESDHAPHALDEKMFQQEPPSGIPSLCFYKYLVTRFLPSAGVGASPELIKKMTHDNIVEVFNNKIGGE